MSRFAKALWFSMLSPILVALISFVAIAVWNHYHSRPTVTQVRFLTPTRPYGVEVKRGTGTCFADFSIADFGAPEAHRCFGRNAIYDPCFNQGSSVLTTTLACEVSPWTPQVVLLRVRKWEVESRARAFKILTFPPDGPTIYKYLHLGTLNTRSNLPWALDLGDGLHCIYATGATDLVRGLRQNYLCVHGDFSRSGWWREAGWVIGLPDRRHALWQVIYLPPGSQSSRQITVKVAWY